MIDDCVLNVSICPCRNLHEDRTKNMPCRQGMCVARPDCSPMCCVNISPYGINRFNNSSAYHLPFPAFTDPDQSLSFATTSAYRLAVTSCMHSPLPVLHRFGIARPSIFTNLPMPYLTAPILLGAMPRSHTLRCPKPTQTQHYCQRARGDDF